MRNSTPAQGALSILADIWVHIEVKRKTQFLLLCGLMVFASFAEVLSIGAVIPFLALLASPEKLMNSSLVNEFMLTAGVRGQRELMSYLTILFVFTIVLAGFIRLILVSQQHKLATAIASDTTRKAYGVLIEDSYSTHNTRSSGDVIATLEKCRAISDMIIYPLFSALSSLLMLIGLVVAMLVISSEVTIVLVSGLTIIYILISYINKAQLTQYSITISHRRSDLTRITQETFRAKREIALNNLEDFYRSAFQRALHSLQYSVRRTRTLAAAPRFFIESLGISFVAMVAYVLVGATPDQGSIDPIPILGAMALGMQRSLPALQQIFISYVSVKSNLESIVSVLNLLNSRVMSDLRFAVRERLEYREEIELVNIGFRYNASSPWIFRYLNFKIRRGEVVGIQDRSGSGKSTLLDVVSFLSAPNEGHIKVDGRELSFEERRNFQALISYVPQNIHIFDASVTENIALGVPTEQVRRGKLEEVIEVCQLRELIDSLPNGLETKVGESGCNLSGGQRQRIGIARALYRRPALLILDEATNAIDATTEELIFRKLKGQGLSVLMVSHSATTNDLCDRLVSMRGIARCNSEAEG